jgi:hypothetical protein
MNWIRDIYVSLAVLTLISYLVRLRNETYFKFIAIYMGVLIIASAVAIVIVDLNQSSSNLIVFHVLAPVEYTVLSLLYYHTFKGIRVKRAIGYSIPVFIMICILFSLYVQPVESNNSYVVIIESTIITLWSLLFLRETIILQMESALQRFPMFWISIGLLFYFIGSVTVEGLLNYLMDFSMDLARRVYRMIFILKYLLFILLMIGAFSRRLFKGLDIGQYSK